MLKIFGLALSLVCLSGYQNFCQVTSPGVQIEQKVNEKFDIKIEACHDAGYRWFLEPVDTTKIKVLSCTSKPVNEKFKFGGNVYETWTFIGLQRGEYQLVFNYRHPWQDKIDRTEKFTVVIN